MTTTFDRIPSSALLEPTRFTVDIPQQSIEDLSTLLKLSPLARPNFESAQEESQFGSKFGVSHAWMDKALKEWKENFDW